MSLHKVINRHNLNDSGNILCFERNNINFLSGQLINLGLNGDDNRTYRGIDKMQIKTERYF